jgi:PAS domain S-box-containing protein
VVLEHNQIMPFGKKNMRLVIDQFLTQYDGGVVVLDPSEDYKIVDVNDLFLIMSGYSRQELLQQHISILNEALYSEESIHRKFQLNESFRITQFHYRKDGSTFWHNIFVMPLKNELGDNLFYLLLANDRTHNYNMSSLVLLERKIHMALEQGEDTASVLHQIADHIAQILKKGCECAFLLFNEPHLLEVMPSTLPSAIKDTIYPLEKKLQLIDEIRSEKISYSLVVNDFSTNSFFAEHNHFLLENHYKAFWREKICDQDGRVIGAYCLYFKDQIQINLDDISYLEQVSSIVSLAIKYHEQRKEILKLAFYDEQTGLRNLTSFKNEVFKRISKNINGTICIIQPTEYQHIVDVYGREYGNQLLRQLGERLNLLCVEGAPIIARFSSSALILSSTQTLVVDNWLREKLQSILNEPFEINNKQLYVTIKIGMSRFSHEVLGDEAIKQADTALSFALKEGGNIIKLFDPKLQLILEEEMEVMSEINDAIRNNEFIPVLQPKVDISTGNIVGFEALARWNSEELGFVSPADFIPVAEKAGIVYKIDRQIFRYVLTWLQERKKQQKPLYIVSINISPSHFYYPNFVVNMAQLMAEYDIDPNLICFEITESIELENMTRAKQIIEQLNHYGFKTSIDDFGIGYSSLSYLQQLPFGEIKIDKSFIDHITEKRMNAVVKSIVQLANAVEMVSVAEGIETEEQHNALKEIGCRIGQGYYYYKPMPFSAIDELI